MAVPLLTYLDQHFPTLDLHRIHSHLRPRRLRLPRLRIPRPTVPRADHFPAFDHPFSQRTAAVQADVVHGTDFAIHVGDADHPVTAGEFLGFIGGGQFGLKCEFDKWHDVSGSAEKSGPFAPLRMKEDWFS